MRKFNAEIVINIGKKFKTRSEFQKKDKGAYAYARKHNLLFSIIPTTYAKKPKTELELNLLKEEALKYKTKKEFEENSKSAYQKIRYIGKLDEYCQHMIPLKVSRPQKILKFILDKLLNEKSLYNYRKIFGNNTELDIFYPSFNLAFEFDGFYWHSRDTHKSKDECKDQLCAKHNIQLFRIKEPEMGYKNFNHCENDLKNQIIYILDKINIYCDKTFTKECVLSINVDKSFLKSELYDMNTIKQNINSSKNYSDFCKKWKHQYEFLRKNKLLNMLDNLEKIEKTNSFATLSNSEIISKIKHTFSTYKEFSRSSFYSNCVKRNIISTIKQILPTERELSVDISNLEFINRILNKFENYHQFAISNEYPRGKNRKVLAEIKHKFKEQKI